MIRDWQRTRVYQAETAAEDRLSDEVPQLSTQDARELVMHVCRREEVSGCKLTVSDRKPHKRSTILATYHLNKVVVYPGGLNMVRLLHELAHHVEECHGRSLFPRHGIEFLAVYMRLIGEYMGEEAVRIFREEFDKRRVHLDVKTRVQRVRRVAVNIANSGGRMVQVVLDEPPRHLVGQLTEANKEMFVIDERVYPMRRARYIESL